MEVVKIKLSWSNVHLVLGERPVLVDSGSPKDCDHLVTALARHGVSPKDLSLIIQTHGHADHAGCAGRLRALSGAPVLVHKADADMLREGKNRPLKPTNLMGRLLIPLVDFPFPTLEPDIEIEGEAEFKPYGLDGHIMPLHGGHTAGSIAVVLGDRKAVVGDILMGGYMGGALFPGRANIHYYADNIRKIREDLRTLVNAGIEVFYAGHGGPILKDSVVRRLLS